MDCARRPVGRACMPVLRWWRAGLPALLVAAFCLSPASASAVPAVEEASARDRSLRCSIVLGPEAPDLEVFAAHELVRYLRELYGIRSELVRDLGTGSGLGILLGNPQTNPAFQSISAHLTWPRVSDLSLIHI